MAMTITEKILAAHAGSKEVRPGELIVMAAGGLMNDVAKQKGLKA